MSIWAVPPLLLYNRWLGRPANAKDVIELQPAAH